MYKQKDYKELVRKKNDERIKKREKNEARRASAASAYIQLVIRQDKKGCFLSFCHSRKRTKRDGDFNIQYS
jgi:replicative superfamily II helicase